MATWRERLADLKDGAGRPVFAVQPPAQLPGWEDATWHVYQTPDGRMRVTAPRRWREKRGDREAKLIPLRPHELRSGERLVTTVSGVSRRTVEVLLRQHGVGGLAKAIAALSA